MIFYRYEDIQYEDGPYLLEYQFSMIKETPCGWWIGNRMGHYGILNKPKWVSKTARKRFAYPTKEDALNNFIARKQRQISIFKYRLDRAEGALYQARVRKDPEYSKKVALKLLDRGLMR